MGWLSRLLSKPVITGFLFGAAIDVVIGELPKLTGHRRRRGRTAGGEFGSWLQRRSTTCTGSTLVVGLGALVAS